LYWFKRTNSNFIALVPENNEALIRINVLPVPHHTRLAVSPSTVVDKFNIMHDGAPQLLPVLILRFIGPEHHAQNIVAPTPLSNNPLDSEEALLNWWA
jgi:hypothetical protein